MIKRALWIALVVTGLLPVRAEIIDRIAAIVNENVITTSEIDQYIAVRLVSRRSDEADDDFRRRVLEDIIAYRLRYRDVERFGAIEVAREETEARLNEIRSRFAGPAEFDAALSASGMSPEELEAIVTRRIQVERYIEERFSPMIFVSLEEIDAYYRNVWLPSRFRDGLPRLGLAAVREEIRAILRSERLQEEVDRWTAELRSRSNVDVYGTR